jgi:acyl dehydratase
MGETITADLCAAYFERRGSRRFRCVPFDSFVSVLHTVPTVRRGTVVATIRTNDHRQTRTAVTKPNPLYLEDLHVGQRIDAGTVTVSAEQIKTFAAMYDPQPFHLDEDAAKSSVFGGLIASGWHTAALTMRLLVDSFPLAGGLIGKGGELVWPNPVRPGDTLHLFIDIVDLTRSKSRPDRGTVTTRMEVQNQRGEPVQIATMKVVVRSGLPSAPTRA